METNVPEPNQEAENFYGLLKDMNQGLWEGCELTKISFLILLLHTKTTNKWSDKSISDLLSILQLAIPNGKSLPNSFQQVKKLLRKLGLNYERINACPNDCQLFWDDTAGDEVCSICGASRWKSVEQTVALTRSKKKKGISAKVLRYFPLTPRLKRLFMCKQTAPLLRWHEEGRTKDGALRHPADSEAWKDFDARHVQFSSEPRNVRFGLASDGFNPFGMLRLRVQEIRRTNRSRRVQTKEIERIQHAKFHDWFRDHIMNLETQGNMENISKDLAWLAKGPIKVARTYRAFNINGYRFRPVRYDKTTQNSGVMLVAKTSSYTRANDPNPVLGDVTYYGRIKEIIELDYNGQFGVVLFKCDWVDVTHGRGIKKDDYGFTLVNFSHLIHSGDKLEHEPFIFASQANQVFYVEDEVSPGWFVAIGLKPREVCDMGNEDMFEGVEHEPYHAALVGDQSWVRSDVEGTTVEVGETYRPIRRTNSF